MSKNFAYPFNPITWQAGPHDFTGDNQLGVHTKETTQRFVPGTRFITWDGKVYKYSKSSGACYTIMLNAFYNHIDSDTNGIDYSLLTNNQNAGDRVITLTNGSTTAIGEDDLAGGFAVIIPTEGTTNSQVMVRTIVGNEIAATAAECKMYLDAPLETAVTTSNYAYVMPSAYNNIKYKSTGGNQSYAGLAGTYVSASGYWFWLQTYGVCSVVCGGNAYLGKADYYRALYGRHDGSVDIFPETNAALTGYSSGSVTDQCVGFVMDNTDADNGATQFMLTISF